MNNLKKICACIFIGTILTTTTITPNFNIKKFVTSRYGVGMLGIGLMGASRILSFTASEDGTYRARNLSFYSHNIGSLILLYSIRSHCCAVLQLLYLLGNIKGVDPGDLA